jgi:hypothetical protein
MTYEIHSVQCGGPGLVLPDNLLRKHEWNNRQNLNSPCWWNQSILTYAQGVDVILYAHDDVTIHDPNWINSIMGVFKSRPDSVVVGMGGAERLGHADLYKRPYELARMARSGYVSNQSDWNVHGGHLDEARQVAVVDAFFMAVRTDFLRAVGGWPVGSLSHHCLDLWVCLEAARRDKEVWAVPVSVTHHGGGSSTKAAYRDAKWLQGGTLDSDHQEPHRYLAREYRDVLPLRVKGRGL